MFGVIGNIRTEAKYGMAKVSIRALYNLWLLHVGLEWGEDNFQTMVVELTTKLLKLGLFLLTFAHYKIWDS